MEWYSNGYSDFLANSIAMIISQLETAPNTNIFYHYSNNDSLCSYKKERLINYFKSKYKIVEVNSDNLKIIDWSDNSATIELKSLEVICDIDNFKQKINNDIELFKEL